MVKDLNYSGLSATPSDYSAPDGDLAIALNLIPEDGALRPVRQPSRLSAIPHGLADDNGLPINPSAVYIHTHSDGVRHIIVRYDKWLFHHELFAAGTDTPTDLPDDLSSWDPMPVLLPQGDIRFAALGDILLVSTVDSLIKLRWKKSRYSEIGSIPIPAIGFTLKRKEVSYPEALPFATSYRGAPEYKPDPNAAIVYDKAHAAEYSNALLANANALVARETRRGRFTQPFLARAAFRLFDGSLVPVTSPVLMVPASAFSPYIDASFMETTGNLQGYFRAVSCSLAIHVPFLPSEWEDMVIALEIYVSAPIFTYDQSKEIDYRLRSATSQQSLTHAAYDRDDPDNDRFFYDGVSFMRKDVGASNRGDGTYWNFPYRSSRQITDEIKSISTFYRIHSITAADLPFGTRGNSLSGYNHTISPPEGKLETLRTLPVLPDMAHTSYAEFAGATMHVYNSRLHLANFRSIPSKGFRLPSAATATYVSIRSSLGPEMTIKVDPCVQFSDKGPLFAYFPHPQAFRAIHIDGDKAYVIPLVTHDFLDGAVYCGDFDDASISPVPSGSVSDLCTVTTGASIPKQSTIYVSEVNNPLVFPARYALSVGSGTVLAIASAAKPLSQGQFGQFPLYAFTTEGVWALEISPTGTYSARQPITRDVCINPASVTPIDSAVLFATDRGIMLISGSTAQCISDPIASDTPVPLSFLPAFDKLCAMAGWEVAACLPIVPFSDFLKECRMLYDYVRRRIIVHSPSRSYAYLYSLKSKLWGMAYSDISAPVNSYPRALAVDKGGNLVDFSSGSGKPLPAMLLTRPIKFDAPDILKTVDTLIQRGCFLKGHVSSVIYGSRDLFSWHLVNSSVSHYFANRRGTPYKYFRIALICNLDKTESVYGCTVQYTPRFTNRPR